MFLTTQESAIRPHIQQSHLHPHRPAVPHQRCQGPELEGDGGGSGDRDGRDGRDNSLDGGDGRKGRDDGGSRDSNLDGEGSRDDGDGRGNRDGRMMEMLGMARTIAQMVGMVGVIGVVRMMEIAGMAGTIAQMMGMEGMVAWMRTAALRKRSRAEITQCASARSTGKALNRLLRCVPLFTCQDDSDSPQKRETNTIYQA